MSAQADYQRGSRLMEWRNQLAVVTGGARGLGRATARLLAQRGAAVCVNYAVHADAAEAVVAEIATADGTLDTYDHERVARMRQVNVDGLIHATRAVMATMRARGYRQYGLTPRCLAMHSTRQRMARL
jgi:3-oxoacyl-[acyl-carrier protein] reductase